MTNSITPPPELLQLWFEQHYAYNKGLNELLIEVARYGADRELEACCEWLEQNQGRWEIPASLRAVRRPKPPSLKEQALKMLRPLSTPVMPGTPEYRLYEPQAEIIRRALEALPDD